MQEFEDSVPSLLQLLENTPEPPVFCFHEAVMGRVHQCSLVPCETTVQGEHEEGERARLDYSREEDNIPTTNKQLKSFMLSSSTPLRKVCSPRNLVLDSDVESGWSFSMATPVSRRQGVKGASLSLTADGESSTLFESTAEESLLGAPKELSNSCEKLRNRVVILPGEKPLGRTLFPRIASPIHVDGDCASHVQRFHSRFEHCTFSPIPLSPLVSSQHRDTTAAKEPLAQDVDCSTVSVSLFGGDSVLLDSLCVAKQGAKKLTTEGDEEEEERCSQELFGSPEVSSVMKREEGRGDERSCPLQLQCNQEREDSLEPHSSNFQQPSEKFPASQAISVQETPISQRQRSHPACPPPLECSTPHPLRHCLETFSPLHISCTATNVQETPNHHTSALPCQHTQTQKDKDSMLYREAEYRLDQNDVLDLLFMSSSQLDTPVSKKHGTIPSPSLPLPANPPASTGSTQLPYTPPSSVTVSRNTSTNAESTSPSSVAVSRNTSTNAESTHSKERTEDSGTVAGKTPHSLGDTVSIEMGATPVQSDATPTVQSDATQTVQSDATQTVQSDATPTNTTDSVQTQIMAGVSGGVQKQQLIAQVSGGVQKQQLAENFSDGIQKHQLATQVSGGVQKQQLGEQEESGVAEKQTAEVSVLKPLTAEMSDATKRQQLTPCVSGGADKQQFAGEVSDVCLESNMSDHRQLRDKLLGRDPQAKRRRLSTKTFLYPGSKPLSSRRKGRRKVERLTSPVSASENMDSDGNCLVGVSSEHINQRIQQFSALQSRRRKSGMVSNTKPPAKKVCLEDASVELVRTGKEVESVVTDRVPPGGVNSGERSPNSCAGTESVKEDFSADTSVVSSKKACDSKQVLRVPDLVSLVNTTPGTPADTCTLATSCTVTTPTSGLAVDGAGQPQCELATELPVQLPEKPKQHHEQQLDSLRGSLPISKKRVKAPGLRRRAQHRSSAPFLLTSSSTPQESSVSRVPDIATNVSESDPTVEACSDKLCGTESIEPFGPSNGSAKATTDMVAEKKAIDDANLLPPSLSVRSLVEDSAVYHSPVTPCDTFVGFQMASGKAVCISKQAIRRAQKLLDEKVVGEDTNKESMGGLNNATPLGKDMPKSIASSEIVHLSKEDDTPSTSGLKTPHLLSSGPKLTSQSAFKAPLSSAVTPTSWHASALPPRKALSTGRKPATRSFKAPRKASSVSKNEEAASLARILRKFGTAESKSTRVVKDRGEGGSKNSGAKTGSETVCNIGMFVTAGGRKLSVSTSAMQRAQQIFNDDKENGVEALLPSGSHQSAPLLNQIVTASVSPPTPELSVPNIQLSGFTTASGRGLTVSAAAMERACSILSMTEEEANPNPGSMETASNKVCHSNNAVESGKEAVCVGFQTASGKSLSVSSQSLSRAESLVAGTVMGGPECGSETYEGSVKTGFQTAAGKGIAVSARTLLDAKKLMPLEGEMDEQEATAFQSEGIPSDHETGFQTANGSKISVQVQSLQHAKSLFEKEPLLNVSTPLTTGFQTAAGRKLSVSTSSMQHAQDMLGSEFQAPLNSSGVNSTHISKPLPTISLCTQDMHSENVSEQCQVLSAEDLDDLDIDNLGAFTQINFHALEEAKGKELAQDDLPEESLRQRDEACCVPLDFVQEKFPSQCLDSGSSQECAVHEDDMWQAAQASSTESPPDELLASGNGPSVPDVEGVDAGCYFSTQMVRQFLDFSSSDGEEEEVEENEEGDKREEWEKKKKEEEKEEEKEKEEGEEKKKKEEEKEEEKEKEKCEKKLEEIEKEKKSEGEEMEKKRRQVEECCQLEFPNKATDAVLPQLIQLAPTSSHVSTKVVGRREEGEEGSQLTESQCLAEEPPSEFGDNSQRTTGISGSVDVVSLAVDKLFDVFPDDDDSISLNVSEVAATDSGTRPLLQTLDNCNELPPSHSPLDPPGVQTTKHPVSKETSTLSPTRAFHMSSQDVEEVVCGSSEERASSKEALETIQDNSVPKCAPDLSPLVDSSLVVDSISLVSGLSSPIANETKTALENNQDHLQQSLSPTTVGPANVSTLNTSLEGESCRESSRGSLLNEVMSVEGRVDTLTVVKEDCEGWWVTSGREAYQSERPTLSEQCISPPGSQQPRSPYTNIQLLNSSPSPHTDVQSLKVPPSPHTDTTPQLQVPPSPHTDSTPHLASSDGSAGPQETLPEDRGSPDDTPPSSSTGFLGLQTAGGKKVEISEEALSQARAVLGKVEQQKVSPSSEIAKHEEIEPVTEEVEECHSSRGFLGFQTASGTRVEVSDHSLRVVKQLLHQSSTAGQGATTVTSPQTPTVDHSQAVADGAAPREEGTKFPGLQTASGSRVEVSEASLKAARRTLHGDASCSGPTARGRFPGLQTASGSRVEVSEASLKAVREVIHGERTGSSVPGSKFPGLMTAKGEKVNITEDALQAAKSTLRLDWYHSPKCVSPGLQMGDGSTSSSATSLAGKSMHHSSSDVNCQAPIKHSTFSGLQTASGGEVTISEQSLAAVRGGNLSGRQLHSRSTTSLMTASGNLVPVSEAALKAVKLAVGETATSLVEGTPSGMLGHESNGSGQAGCVSPIRTESVTTVPLNYHTKTFPSSQSLPDSSHSTPAPQAKGKFKPVFHSTGRRGGGHPPTAHSSPALQQPHPSHPHTPQPHFSQLHTPRVQGTITTPEALFHDRSSRRPLLPMQTFLNQDGSYVSATPTRRYPQQGRSALQLTRQHQPPMSVMPQPHISNPTPRPPVSHSHVSTPRPPVSHSHVSTPRPPVSHSHVSSPRPNFHVPCSSETSHHQQKYFNRVAHPQNSSVISSVGQTVGFATPRRSVGQRNPCAPVWRSSLSRGATQGNNSSRTAPYPLHGPSVLVQHEDQSPLHGPSVLVQHDDQSPLHPINTSSHTKDSLPPFSHHLVTSTQRSNPPNRGVSTYSTTRKVSSDGGSSMTTSTQIVSEDHTIHGCPLSPINITLSQICALENSQLETTQVEESHEGEKGENRREEDSGYQSKNQIDSRSPGMEGTAHEGLSNSVNSGATSPTVVQSYDMEDSAVFAEIATELLNDSLDEEEPERGEDTSHPKHQTTVPQPPNRMAPCPPKTSLQAHLQSKIPSYHSITNQSTSVCVPSPPPPSGPIKPQTGSLLAARMFHRSQRIPLTVAVGTPPGGYSPKQLHSLGVHPSVVEVSVRNAVEFKFGGFHYFSAAVLSGSPVCVGDGAMLRLKDGCAGVREFWEAFSQSPGVDSKLISLEWFANHYKWVVWKLASLEVSFPHQFGGQSLTPDWLMMQLKYRYDREIDRAERSAFHKIFEQDDIPSRTMVLCVSAVDLEKLDSREHCDKNSSKTEKDGSLVDGDRSLSSDPPCIEVTDGWYSMPAVLDTPLKRMVKCGKISLGTKLITYGSEILGASDPTPPLEAPASLALKLHGNSTRRARWFSRLGYQRLPHPFPVPLTSVFPDGGLVGCVDVMVVRVYPLLCMEKVEGRSIFRRERVEARLRASHETARQREIEKICARVQKDFEEEMTREEGERVTSRRRSRRRLHTLQVKQLQDGEEIYNALMNAPDPTAFQELLTRTQCTLLESYQLSVQSQRQAELERRICQAIEEAEEELPPSRNVVPLLRARLVPLKPHSSPFDCHLSVWRPGEEVKSVMREGRALRMFNINATPSRYKPSQRLQLTASRSTRYELIPVPPDQLSMCYTPRHCTAIAAISHVELAWGEFDTVGIVVCITTANIPGTERADRLLASVYLADDSGELLVVKVWDGLKAHALEDLVVPGVLVAVSNLSYQGLGYGHHLPSANAGESSVFSQHPREQHLKTALQELLRNMPKVLFQLQDKRKEYLQTLEERINF